jgi:hypothetical protein
VRVLRQHLIEECLAESTNEAPIVICNYLTEKVADKFGLEVGEVEATVIAD